MLPLAISVGAFGRFAFNGNARIGVWVKHAFTQLGFLFHAEHDYLARQDFVK